MKKNNPWLSTEPDKTKAIRIFLLPHAGGGASAFKGWPALFPESWQLIAVQPPGREQRIAETAFTKMPLLIEAMHEAIKQAIVPPYCMLGHSMGGKIVYEWTKKILGEQLPAPEFLFVSGCRPPHIPEPAPLHNLDDPEFIEVVPIVRTVFSGFLACLSPYQAAFTKSCS